VTSAVVGNHLPELLSGPCRCLRYHELNTHKVTKGGQELNASVGACRTSSLADAQGPALPTLPARFSATLTVPALYIARFYLRWVGNSQIQL